MFYNTKVIKSTLKKIKILKTTFCWFTVLLDYNEKKVFFWTKLLFLNEI